MKETKNKSEPCSICGTVHKSEELVEFEGKKLCPECLARETLVCSHCWERIWNVDTSDTLSVI